MKGGTALSTASDYTVDLFVPTASQWRTDSIDVSTLVAGQSNIMFSFRNHGHYGQGLYLDNVNLSYTVSAAATPTANFATPVSICSGATITFTDASTGSPTSWNWTLPGSSSPTSSLQNPVVSYSNSGTYNATLTVSNGTGTNTIVKSVTVNATPSLTTSVSSASVCAGASTTLTASGASSYTWTPGGTGATIVVTPSTTTTYTLKGATGSCTSSVTRSLSVSPNPTVSVNSATTCAGTTVTLTANGASTYSWSSGQSTAVINPAPTITTVYTVTGTTGICSVAKTSTVTVNPNPTVTVNSATICAGNSATLTASGASSYSWSAGFGPTIVVSPTTTSSYTVTGFSGSCSNTKVAGVTVNSVPGVTVSAAQNTVCAAGTAPSTTVALTGNPSGGVFSGTGVTGATFNAPAGNGTFTATYSFTDTSTGCSSSDSTSIVVSMCMGLNEFNLLNGTLVVFPNPNNGIFTISLNSSQSFDVMIYNTIGQLVVNETKVNQSTDIDLNNFGRGIYSVLVKQGENYKTIKVIVE
jgi:PKD repeat protein